ncbi:MAG: aldehyde dehydrogenase family protein [Candidatus Paceibacteria bacterium]
MAETKKRLTAQKKKVSKEIVTPTVCLDYSPYSKIDFVAINKQANDLVDHLEAKYEELAHILLEYESYEVVTDEISRTFDLLRHLKENEEYFKLRIGAVASFLPRNQPLYALSCFVLVPSLMASEVHFRIPQSMTHFFPKLLALLEVNKRFPNVKVSIKQRQDFLKERSALRVDPDTKEAWPVTEVVIFTGTPVHADQLRNVFDQRTLFITNGAGHNPIVVSEDADINKAVEAAIMLKFYNQGQDCASPNSIMVHKNIFNEFMRILRDEIRTVRVGDYRDRKCRVGPVSDPNDLVRIQGILIDNREWLDPTTPGIIRAYDAILEPTIINKPLRAGANFDELFAPALIVQKYDDDSDLAIYFEDPRYALNAMYITVYGTSKYVKKFMNTKVAGRVLHEKSSFLHNAHLHMYGYERGTQPYGGNGYGASSISINGVVTPKATLPQRDIFEWVAKPLLTKSELEKRKRFLADDCELVYKDVQKLMRLKTQFTENDDEGNTTSLTEYAYLDREGLEDNKKRYTKLDPEQIYTLLEVPNATFITKLSIEEVDLVRKLKRFIETSIHLEPLDFSTKLYALPADPNASKAENRKLQFKFFRLVYQLLFGKDSGPRLAQFIQEVDQAQICKLIDV